MRDSHLRDVQCLHRLSLCPVPRTIHQAESGSTTDAEGKLRSRSGHQTQAASGADIAQFAVSPDWNIIFGVFEVCHWHHAETPIIEYHSSGDCYSRCRIPAAFSGNQPDNDKV